MPPWRTLPMTTSRPRPISTISVHATAEILATCDGRHIRSIRNNLLTRVSIRETNMLQDKAKPIDAAQYQEARPVFVPGPLLTDLLSDPIMHMLTTADRVEYRD